MSTATASPSSPPPADDGAQTAQDAGSPYPPTGEYTVTERVVSDDCRPAYKPPEPWTASVQAGAERKYAKVNVPLVGIPSSNARTNDRSDAVIEPRKTVKETVVPFPACKAYTVTRSLDIVEASSKGFKIAVTVEHGDASQCSSTQPPSKCTTKVEQSYALTRAVCAAECTRGFVFHVRDGGAPGTMDGGGSAPMEADCRCP